MRFPPLPGTHPFSVWRLGVALAPGAVHFHPPQARWKPSPYFAFLPEDYNSDIITSATVQKHSNILIMASEAPRENSSSAAPDTSKSTETPAARPDKTYTDMATSAAASAAETASSTAQGVKNSVFSMFGGGGGSAKKEESKEDQEQDRSGSSKAVKEAKEKEKEAADEGEGGDGVSCFPEV